MGILPTTLLPLVTEGTDIVAQDSIVVLIQLLVSYELLLVLILVALELPVVLVALVVKESLVVPVPLLVAIESLMVIDWDIANAYEATATIEAALAIFLVVKSMEEEMVSKHRFF